MGIKLPAGINTPEKYLAFVNVSPENAAYISDLLSGKNSAKKALKPKVAADSGCVYACFPIVCIYVKVKFPILPMNKSVMIAQTCELLKGLVFIECCSSLKKGEKIIAARKKDGSPDVIWIDSKNQTIPESSIIGIKKFLSDSIELSQDEALEFIYSWEKKNWQANQEQSIIEARIVQPIREWPLGQLTIEELSTSHLPNAEKDLEGNIIEETIKYPIKEIAILPQHKSQGHDGFIPAKPTIPNSIQYLRQKLIPGEEIITEKAEGGKIRFEVRVQTLERSKIWGGTAYIRIKEFPEMRKPNLRTSKNPVYKIIWEE